MEDLVALQRQNWGRDADRWVLKTVESHGKVREF